MYGDTYLPRKFKTGFALPPSNDVDIFSQDLGFIAIEENGQPRRLQRHRRRRPGHEPRQRRDLPAAGRRARVHPAGPGQRHRRGGADDAARFRRPHQPPARAAQVHHRGSRHWTGSAARWSGAAASRSRPARPFEFTTIEDPLGWHECADGTWFYGLHILSGRIKDVPGWPMKTALREIAQIHTGDFRLTPSQNLTISGVTPEQKPVIDGILAKHGLAGENDRSGLRLTRCPASRCPPAGWPLAESERVLPDILGKIRDRARRGRPARRRHQPAHHRLPERLRASLPGRDRVGRARAEQVRAVPRREVQRHAAQPPLSRRASPSTTRVGAAHADHQALRRRTRGRRRLRRFLRPRGAARRRDPAQCRHAARRDGPCARRRHACRRPPPPDRP